MRHQRDGLCIHLLRQLRQERHDVCRGRLRLQEVPVKMRARESGRSSITTVRSVYYMIKVVLAIFVALFRRKAVPLD